MVVLFQLGGIDAPPPAHAQMENQRVIAVGGTLSGEHGIGNDKAAYMPLVFGPDSMRLQWAVPMAFNPKHQLNPLKVFNNRRFTT